MYIQLHVQTQLEMYIHIPGINKQKSPCKCRGFYMLKSENQYKNYSKKILQKAFNLLCFLGFYQDSKSAVSNHMRVRVSPSAPNKVALMPLK